MCYELTIDTTTPPTDVTRGVVVRGVCPGYCLPCPAPLAATAIAFWRHSRVSEYRVGLLRLALEGHTARHALDRVVDPQHLIHRTERHHGRHGVGDRARGLTGSVGTRAVGV